MLKTMPRLKTTIMANGFIFYFFKKRRKSVGAVHYYHVSGIVVIGLESVWWSLAPRTVTYVLSMTVCVVN